MDSQKFYSPKEKILLIVLLLASSLSLLFFFLFKTLAFPEYNIKFATDRQGVAEKAKAFLQGQGVQASAYKDITIFDIDDTAKTYLERETSVDETAGLAQNTIDLWHFNSRFVRPLQKEEFIVSYLPNGRFSGYTRIIEEDKKSASLTKQQARTIAEDFIKSKTQNVLSDWNLIDENSVQRKNRTDYQFEWEKKDLHIKEAVYRMRVAVQGDQIGEYSEYLKVPEIWQRQYAQERSQNTLAQIITEAIAFLLLGISSIVFFILRYRNNELRFSFGIIVGIVSFVITFLAAMNALPLALYGYDTTQSWTAFIGQIISGAAFESMTTSLLYFFVIVVGESFYRQYFPDRIAMQHLFGKGFFTKEVNKSLFIGSFVGVISFAYVVLYYIIGKQFGYWSPAEVDYSDAFSTVIPWIYPVFIGFSATIFEEGLFRLFGIVFLLQFIKNRWLAVVIMAFCWSFLHSNYPQSPWFARGIEVGIEGLVFGFLYLRFGILAPLTAHYTFDALMTSVALSSSASLFNTIISILLSLLPFFVATGLLLYAMSKKGFFTDIKEFTNKSLSELVHKIKPEAQKTVRIAAASYRSALTGPLILSITVLAVISFFVIAAIAPGITLETPPHSINRTQALALANAVVPQARQYQSIVMYNSYPPDTLEEEYILEHADMKTLQKIYPSQIPTALWQVRFFKPLQKEEYYVFLLPEGPIYEITHVLSEEAKGANLSEKQALAVAEGYLIKQHEPAAVYKVKESHQDKHPNRTDYTFTFEKTNWKAGEATMRIDITIAGNEPTRFRKYIQIPEDWIREKEKTTFLDFIFGITLLVPGILLFVYGLLIFFKFIKQRMLNYKQALLLSLPFLALSILQVFNKLPLFYSGYDTSIPLGSFIIEKSIGTVVSQIFFFLMITVIVGLFIALWRINFGNILPADIHERRLYFRDALFMGYTFPFLFGTADILASYILLRFRLFPVIIQTDDLSGLDHLSPVMSILYNLGLGILGITGAAILLLLLKRRLKSVISIVIVFLLLSVLALVNEAMTFGSSPIALAVKIAMSAVGIIVAAWVVVKIIKNNILAYVMMVYSGLVFAGAWFFRDQENFYYQINSYMLFVLGVLPVVAYLLLQFIHKNRIVK